MLDAEKRHMARVNAFYARHPNSVAVHAAITAALAVAVLAIWAATGGGYFWPGFVIGYLVYLLVAHGMGRWFMIRPQSWERSLDRALFTSVIMGVGGGAAAALLLDESPLRLGFFMLTFSLAFNLIQLRFSPGSVLDKRVEQLIRTRRGVLDVQADELRRIERDLHDGAQARIVSLSMQLGRAEEELVDRPGAAQLVRQAREEANTAIAELRNLARGIAPPVLADRGLGPAVEDLGRHAAIPVAVDAEIDRRLPTVIESAAYFVVAESLTNVAKHAEGATAKVRLRLEDDTLMVEVADDGPGGANPEGGGLDGLRRRVEALDGSLTVLSPPGEGTTVCAELPCE